MLKTTMTVVPETREVVSGFTYWAWCFIFLPFMVVAFMSGLYDDSVLLSWVQIGYHIFNMIAALIIFRQHISDGLFDLSLDYKEFFKTILSCLGIEVVLLLIACLISLLFPSQLGLYVILNALPISEFEVFMLPSFVLEHNPIFGSIAMVLTTPVSISCLIYGTGFAPGCEKHPLRGYLFLLLTLVAHKTFCWFTLLSFEFAVFTFFVQLPVHISSCIAYQKTSNILAPMVMISISNLLVSLLWLL